MLPVLVCVAPDIAQERRMQRVAQARLTLSCWISDVDDHRGALERARTTRSYLVAEETAEQSSSSRAGQCAQTMLVRYDSWKERK